MKTLRTLILTGLGSGLLPIAPGTWGSAAACVVVLALLQLTAGRPVPLNIALAVLAVLSSIGCVATGRFAQDTYGKKDPGQCVIDEWAGQAVTLIALPYTGTTINQLVLVGSGFLAFRLFDIIKLPPARQLERLPLGWGVLLDDLVAGVQAWLVLQVLFRAILRW